MCALKLLFVCILFPTTEREVCPRLWPSTSTKTFHIKQNEKGNQIIYSFLSSFCPCSRTSALRLMFHRWNRESNESFSIRNVSHVETDIDKTPAKCLCHAKNNIWLEMSNTFKKMFNVLFYHLETSPRYFSSCRIWSEITKETMTVAICYLTKPSQP